jgi:hypothetical protein
MISNIKTSNIIMKGESKPITSQPTHVADRNFNIEVSQAKHVDKTIKFLKQKDPYTNNSELNKTQKSIHQNQNTNVTQQHKEDKPQIQSLNEIIESPENQQEKQGKSKEAFEILEDNIILALADHVPDLYQEIVSHMKPNERITYSFFKILSSQPLDNKVIQLVTNEINNLVEQFYNILSEKINEFISIFIIFFEAYLDSDNCFIEEYDDISLNKTNFEILHFEMIIFLSRCQKNKSEEMYFLFRFSIIEKIFEAINNREYRNKLKYLVELLYKILDPIDNQQITFIRFLKDNVIHEFFDTFSENFMDGCIFYILIGLKHECSRIRNYSLLMLMIYIERNMNFYVNFESMLFICNYFIKF